MITSFIRLQASYLNFKNDAKNKYKRKIFLNLYFFSEIDYILSYYRFNPVAQLPAIMNVVFLQQTSIFSAEIINKFNYLNFLYVLKNAMTNCNFFDIQI